MNFKKQLKLYLSHKGITASQLAKKTGVPRQSLSDWLAGSNPRDVRQVKKVAEEFDVTLDHLLFGNGLVEEKMKLPQVLVGEEWSGGLFEVKFRKVKLPITEE